MRKSHRLTDFGKWLKVAMAEREMTQRDLSLKLGISEVNISRYIHGARYPREDEMNDICNLFGYHIEIVPNKS